VGICAQKVGRIVMGFFHQNTIVTISPANTNPGLTKEEFAQENGINFALLHPTGSPPLGLPP
jgi:hypothetical protein